MNESILLEALKWYADSGNYLAENPDGSILATAYCQDRIADNATEAIKKWEANYPEFPDSSGKETGMKWVKASERLPEDGIYYCRYLNNGYIVMKKQDALVDGKFQEYQYRLNQIEWLDESVPPYKEPNNGYEVWEEGDNGKLRPPAALQNKILDIVNEQMEKYISAGGLTNRFSIRGFAADLMAVGYKMKNDSLAVPPYKEEETNENEK